MRHRDQGEVPSVAGLSPTFSVIIGKSSSAKSKPKAKEVLRAVGATNPEMWLHDDPWNCTFCVAQKSEFLRRKKKKIPVIKV